MKFVDGEIIRTPEEIKKSKELKRKVFKMLRDRIPDASAALRSVAAWRLFFYTPEYKTAKTIMLYSEINKEPMATVFAEKIITEGKRIAFPKTDKENKRIIPYYIDSLSSLKKDIFGIAEPDLELLGSGRVEAANKDDIDIVIVPGLAFDVKGGRLGYGGGYYDRFLADFKGLKVGLTYRECRAYYIPQEEHDCKMDMVLTENGCDRLGQSIGESFGKTFGKKI